MKDKSGFSQKFENSIFVRVIKRNSSILIALVILIMFFSIMSDRFFTGSNALNVLRQISTNAIIAFGMTFVLLIGGIDLSVGSILAASNCISIGLMAQGMPIWLGILVGLLIGAVLGFVNGVIIAKGKIPPFITTLAMMTIARGVAYVYTGGRPIRFDNEFFKSIGNGRVFNVPIPIIIMLICFIICVYILNNTRFGIRIYGVGGNRESAVYSGINVERIEMSVYVISGVLSAISGVILGARMNSAQPIAGEGAELDAIAAVVLGGTSLSGGIGTIGGTIIGALLIGVLNTGLNLIQVPFYWQQILKGIIIILAVFIDSVKKQRKRKLLKTA